MTKRLFSTFILCAGLSSANGQAPTAAPANPAAAAAEAAKPAPPEPDPSKPLAEQIDMDKISYLIGRSFGDNLTRSYVEVNFDALMKGLQTALAKEESTIAQEDAEELMNAFRGILGVRANRMRQLEAFGVDEQGWADLAAKNAAEGEKFFAENAKREGVKTTAQGFQYEILKAGTGEIPKLTDKVKAIYKGTLIDGTVFDDSQGAERPFSVNRVVKGWTEALQMMPVGSKWKLYLPGDLAYGASGNRPPIGPNATLIFEMELASITKPVQAVTPPVGIDIPPRGGASVTPAQPKKRITATTPPVTVPLPKKPAETPQEPQPETKKD